MGRVRTKTIKRASRELIEKYYHKLTLDFHVNKKILEDVATVSTKRLRNKIAGFTTHLMKRIQKGPVRGISLKIQEEERERLYNVVPKESRVTLEAGKVDVEKDIIDMMKEFGYNKLVDKKYLKEREAGTN
jgi:small subunit ribosomal protein S17e